MPKFGTSAPGPGIFSSRSTTGFSVRSQRMTVEKNSGAGPPAMRPAHYTRNHRCPEKSTPHHWIIQPSAAPCITPPERTKSIFPEFKATWHDSKTDRKVDFTGTIDSQISLETARIHGQDEVHDLKKIFTRAEIRAFNYLVNAENSGRMRGVG